MGPGPIHILLLGIQGPDHLQHRLLSGWKLLQTSRMPQRVSVNDSQITVQVSQLLANRGSDQFHGLFPGFGETVVLPAGFLTVLYSSSPLKRAGGALKREIEWFY